MDDAQVINSISKVLKGKKGHDSFKGNERVSIQCNDCGKRVQVRLSSLQEKAGKKCVDCDKSNWALADKSRKRLSTLTQGFQDIVSDALQPSSVVCVFCRVSFGEHAGYSVCEHLARSRSCLHQYRKAKRSCGFFAFWGEIPVITDSIHLSFSTFHKWSIKAMIADGSLVSLGKNLAEEDALVEMERCKSLLQNKPTIYES